MSSFDKQDSFTVEIVKLWTPPVLRGGVKRHRNGNLVM